MEVASLAIILAICRYALCEDSYAVSGDVVNFAVGMDSLFVLTNSRLHQIRLDLNSDFSEKQISNATTSNKVEILVPFISNNTVIVCGSMCEILDIHSISTMIHKEDVSIGSYPNVAFITGHGDNKYLLVGRNEQKVHTAYDGALVTLRNTNDSQVGGIFSRMDRGGSGPSAGIQNIDGTEVRFVDGFHITAYSHVYLLANVKNGNELKVKVLNFDNTHTKDPKAYTKASKFETLQDAVLQCCEDDKSWMLLSSAVITGESPILWAGVFQDQTNPGDTAVAIFDISRSHTAKISDFCTNTGGKCDKGKSAGITDEVLNPDAVILRNSSIKSVAALKTNSWIVLFLNTQTGLLIKVVLDESLNPGCPTVLYSSAEDQPFLAKMLFAPVNHTHIYMAQGNQMRRVPVAQCGVYQTLRDCWSALDPFCGWCLPQSRCSFQHDCSSTDWVSVPGTSKQRDIISVLMIRSDTGQDITVTALPNLNRGLRFSCALEKCDSPGPSSCSCILSSESFPAEGLSLRVKITVQRETITKEVHLKNCSSIRGTPTSALCKKCFSEGCVWSPSGHACTWRTESTQDSETSQDVCNKITPGQNHTKPEILSITPDEVSIHGRNSAVIKGRNLQSVTKVRFQGNLDCNPKEAPVLSHSHESVTFHIPSGMVRGTVSVCVLTPDDECHGNGKLTYNLPPVCSILNPKTTWASGGREISFKGSNLEFVEKVKHVGPLEDIAPLNIAGAFSYSSPAVLDSVLPRQVSVLLVVGNTTVTCRDKLTYQPDPQFISFTTTRTGNDMSVIIQKAVDSLELKESEIKVEAVQGENLYPCVIEKIESSNDITSVLCDIRSQPGISIDSLRITVGKVTSTLHKGRNWMNGIDLIRFIIFTSFAICGKHIHNFT